MKTHFLSTVAALAVLVSPALAEDFFVFKASASLPVLSVLVGLEVDKSIKLTLVGNDLVNLALGRPFGTKVDTKTEILALAATFEDPSNAPLAKLIVFDPTQNGLAQVKAVIATLSSLDYSVAFLATSGKGQGIASGNWVATALGDPLKSKLEATPFHVAGEARGPRVQGNQLEKQSPTGISALTGRMKFKFTDRKGVTSDFDGFVVKGSIKCAGKRIGIFTEN